MSMELAVVDQATLPDGARAMPGYTPQSRVIRFPNNYGASVIANPKGGSGVELAVIRFTSADNDEWVFEADTLITHGGSIIPSILTMEELVGYLEQIAALEKYREEYIEGELRFVWVSNAYIDVHWTNHDELPPFTCIGIYDYAAGKCEITGRDEFIAKCREWKREADEENDEGESEVDNYRRHTLPPYM